MIRLTLELLPLGDERHKRHLGTIHLINDGTGTRTCGNYTVRLLSRHGGLIRRARVEGHPRLAVSVWKLVAKALTALGHTA